MKENYVQMNWGSRRLSLIRYALAVFLVAGLILSLSPRALSKSSPAKSRKESKWVLEFKWVASGPGGQSETWSKVEFLVPKGGGPVDAQGAMWLTGSKGEKGEGVMVIEGNISKKRLTFVPDQKYMTVTAGGYTANLEVFQTQDKIRMPFRDGAKLVQRFSDKGGTTETTWTLKGIEEWRITVDSRQIAFPGRPSLALLPKQHFAGLRNQWRLVLDFEVTKDSYIDGKGKFSVVKWDSYSNPAGLYKAVHLRHRVLMKTADVGGDRSGQWVTFYLPEENYINFLYRLEIKKEGTSYRVEGEPVRLPSSPTFKLVEGRREYKHFSGPLSEKKHPETMLYRGKPEANFWKLGPFSAHVVILVKRIK